MKWETPQAVELRFGMEITMYVVESLNSEGERPRGGRRLLFL